MKKYEVIMTLKLERTVIIEANSEEEAEAYASTNIELDMDDADICGTEVSAWDADEDAEIDYSA